jgi:excinuclease ABC subunit C
MIYVYGQEDEPVSLDRHSPILHLVQQIRDETHRFAVTFHRQRRARRQVATILTEVPGVGPRTAARLLQQFGSAAHLRNASLEEVSRHVPRAQAEKILRFLRDGPEPANRQSNA